LSGENTAQEKGKQDASPGGENLGRTKDRIRSLGGREDETTREVN